MIGRARAGLVAVAVMAAWPARPLRAEPAAAAARTPMGDAARRHFERGLAAYQQHDYATALVELRAGFAIEPHPDFLFPWAQAERLSGDCDHALGHYRQVLAQSLDPVDRADVVRLIGLCERVIASRPAPPPAPAVDLGRAPGPVGSTATPWYRDPWGDGLLVAGAVGLAVGTGFLVAAHGAATDADNATTLEDFVRSSDLADRRQAVGALGLGVGAVLVGAAVVRYVLRAPAEGVVAVTASGDAGAVVLLGRF